MGIDVKSDTESKETMISCGSMVFAEIFSTKSLLFLKVGTHEGTSPCGQIFHRIFYFFSR